jgi:hypothetical protein
MTKKKTHQPTAAEENNKFPLPVYKPEDDIYNRQKEEPLEGEEQLVEGDKVKTKGKLGEGLDVPGAELDDADEAVGEEDEENNYYSLGGDNHDDLEEDKE